MFDSIDARCNHEVHEDAMFRVIVIGKQSKIKKGRKMAKENKGDIGGRIYLRGGGTLGRGRTRRRGEGRKKKGQAVSLWGTEEPI